MRAKINGNERRSDGVEVGIYLRDLFCKIDVLIFNDVICVC